MQTPVRAKRRASPSPSTNSPPAAAGASTAALVDSPATRAIAGAIAAAASAEHGGAISRPYASRLSTSDGKPPAPPPDSLNTNQLPYNLAISAALLYDEETAIEVIVFAGAGRLIVGDRDVELEPGQWLVARVSGPADCILPLQLPLLILHPYPPTPPPRR